MEWDFASRDDVRYRMYYVRAGPQSFSRSSTTKTINHFTSEASRGLCVGLHNGCLFKFVNTTLQRMKIIESLKISFITRMYVQYCVLVLV